MMQIIEPSARLTRHVDYELPITNLIDAVVHDIVVECDINTAMYIIDNIYPEAYINTPDKQHPLKFIKPFWVNSDIETDEQREQLNRSVYKCNSLLKEREWVRAIYNAWVHYTMLTKRYGLSAELAMGVLPHATALELVMPLTSMAVWQVMLNDLYDSTPPTDVLWVFDRILLELQRAIPDVFDDFVIKSMGELWRVS